ncbi:MAG: OsmC family protein [Anaerolineales bacterium]|nr:OsmC family protein [Anaerolineales bacterium]
MDVTMNWMGKMSFEGMGESGVVQKIDADTSVGGENGAPRPMELLAMGLAGCTGMDVISILQKKQQPVVGFQVNLRAERAEEHPKVFTQAVIEYLVIGRGVNEAALLRSIELSAERYCPAQAMLGKAFPMRLIYKILDEESKVVLREGEYVQKSK